MITKQHRFHGHQSLGLVYRRGRTVRDQYVTLRFIRNQRRKTYRLAVIVGRKVHKSAVLRNRVRRRLYEAVRANEGSIAGPYDIVLSVFSDQLIDMPPQKLMAMITRSFKRAGITEQLAGAPAEQPHAIVKTNQESL